MSAASGTTPLLKILGERIFLLYVNDPTCAGKTTTLYLGSSAIVDEKVIRSFDTTKNGLAVEACEFNDYPFFIDEKQVADSRIRKQLDLLVYALANGIGHTKLNKDSTLNKIPDWRTISIMTGETQLLPVNVTGGVYTRLLTLSTSDKVIPSNICKKIRDKVKYNYGFALPLVIDEIRRLGVSKLNDLYIELVRSFNKDFPNILEEHRRYVAIVTITDYLLNVALFGDSNAEEDIWNNSISNSIEIFSFIPSRVEIADVQLEESVMRNFIVKNQSRFVNVDTEISKMPVVYGKFDGSDGFYYIIVGTVKKACKLEQFDYRKLVADLVDSKFFIASTVVKRHYRRPLAFVQKRIGQLNVNCYRITCPAFKIKAGDEPDSVDNFPIFAKICLLTILIQILLPTFMRSVMLTRGLLLRMMGTALKSLLD